MEIKSYRWERDEKTKDFAYQPRLDNDGMKELKCIIASKDQILSSLNGSTAEINFVNASDEEARISVSENGIRINFAVIGDDRDFSEYATLYIFDNGEVCYVFNGLDNWNYGYLGSNEKITKELDDKFGKFYKLVEEKSGIKEFFSHTKERNQQIKQLCKLKVETLITNLQQELEKEQANVEEVDNGFTR